MRVGDFGAVEAVAVLEHFQNSVPTWRDSETKEESGLLGLNGCRPIVSFSLHYLAERVQQSQLPQYRKTSSSVLKTLEAQGKMEPHALDTLMHKT
jgi:hypothetical protein